MATDYMSFLQSSVRVEEGMHIEKYVQNMSKKQTRVISIPSKKYQQLSELPVEEIYPQKRM